MGSSGRNRRSKKADINRTSKIHWIAKNKEWLFSGVGVFVVLGLLGYYAHDRQLVQHQSGGRHSVNLQAGDNSKQNVLMDRRTVLNINKENTATPNALKNIYERVEMTGDVADYFLEDDEDFNLAIDYLKNFVEEDGRKFTSPVILSLSIEEFNRPGESGPRMIKKISPMDAIEQLKSHLLTKRFPIRVKVFPEAVVSMDGKAVFWALGISNKPTKEVPNTNIPANIKKLGDAATNDYVKKKVKGHK